MTSSLSHLHPTLSSIPGVNIPVGVLQSLSIAASGRKIEQFERALRHEVGLLNAQIETGELHLDGNYAGSEAFTANVLQAIRAAETAESEAKLRFIARALNGCALSFPPPTLDRFQTLRIVEGMSEREVRVLVGLLELLGPIDPYAGRLPVDSGATVAGLTRQEFTAALLGLQQLGLLTQEAQAETDNWTAAHSGPAWKLTALARQVATLCRIEFEEL